MQVRKFVGDASIYRIKKLLKEVVRKLIFLLHKYTYPLVNIIDYNGKTLLDAGCGTGNPARLLQLRSRFFSVGVDVFRQNLLLAKKERTYREYLLADVRYLPFKRRTFDIILCLQVIEHLPKKEATNLVTHIEALARRQVVITTPIGFLPQKATDNPYDIHISGFTPNEFLYRGYKIKKIGITKFYAQEGIAFKKSSSLLSSFLYAIEPLFNLFFIFIPRGTHYFIAFKNLKEQSDRSFNSLF